MTGGNYFSPEMQVPDTVAGSMAPPKKILFTWNCGFGSSYNGADGFVLGTEGPVARNDFPASRNSVRKRSSFLGWLVKVRSVELIEESN
jgi:hypothetical protein